MRLTGVAAMLALGALACGKKGDQAQANAAPATPSAAPATAAAAEPTGPVVEVKMMGSGNVYKFDPSTITVPAGGTGGFYNLAETFLINPNDHYDVSVAGLPTGTYKGFCTPHQALGMHFVLTVK